MIRKALRFLSKFLWPYLKISGFLFIIFMFGFIDEGKIYAFSKDWNWELIGRTWTILFLVLFSAFILSDIFRVPKARFKNLKGGE